MSGLSSNSMRMLEKSVDFLWAKQSAHLDNIANAETPGYKTKTVTFEEQFSARLAAAANRKDLTRRKAIRSAIEGSDWTVWEDDEITRMDENGVNVTEQMVESIRTAYQLQYTYQAINSDLGRLSKAING